MPPAGRGVFDVNTHTPDPDQRRHQPDVCRRRGSGQQSRFRIRHFWQDTSVATDLFPGQPTLIDQSWSAGPMATRQLHSLGLLIGSTMGVTALRGGQVPPFDEPMNNALALPALDCNHGCTNAGTAPGTYDTLAGFRSSHRWLQLPVLRWQRSLRPRRADGRRLPGPVHHGWRRGRRRRLLRRPVSDYAVTETFRSRLTVLPPRHTVWSGL